MARSTLRASESAIELAICHLLKANKYTFWKIPMAGYFDASKGRFRKHASPFVGVGMPDIVVILKGLFIGLECKALNGKVSEIQKARHDEIRNAGGLVYVVRSVEDAKSALAHAESIVTNKPEFSGR